MRNGILLSKKKKTKSSSFSTIWQKNAFSMFALFFLKNETNANVRYIIEPFVSLNFKKTKYGFQWSDAGQYDMIGHVLPIATQRKTQYLSLYAQTLKHTHRHRENNNFEKFITADWWIPANFNGGYFASNKY